MTPDQLTLAIDLADGRTAYRPGERISGHITVQSPAPWTAERLELALFWRTEGKGNSNTGLHGLVFYVKQSGEQLPASLRQAFHVTLPQHPWSYAGRIIKLHWWIGLYAKRQGVNEQYLEVPLWVRNGG